jgi:outer membrane receptor protein involved in Fe transport
MKRMIEARVRELGVALLALLLFSCYSSRGWGQADQGTITGVVQDSTGAAIPNANVTLTNPATGFVLKRDTDASGVYVFSPIKVGSYTISATAPGFQTTSQKNIQVNVSGRASADLKLQAGAATEQIEVTGAPAQLQSEEASTGTTVSTQTINQTPLNGRNFVFIAQLTAGVLPSNTGSRGAASGDFSANGQRAEQNNFILDGVDNNTNLVDFLNGASFVIKPPPDALQEFRVQTGDYSAELGHSAGAVLNASIKSGTNDLHGSVWEYFRNDVLNARNFFPQGAPKPEYRQNQFGATLGGPIIKDKLFFFADAEANRIIFGQNGTGLYTVPTPLMRQGNFTELLSPTLTNGNTRNLFLPGGPTRSADGKTILNQNYLSCNGQINVICPNLLDPVALKLINALPAPNTGIPGQTYNNYQFQSKASDNTTQYDARVDWNISPNDQTFGRYSYSNRPQAYPTPFGELDGGSFGTSGAVVTEGRNFTASETHVFTPSLTNELRFGYNWIHASFQQQNIGANLSPTFGLGGIPFGPQNGGLPYFIVNGLSSFGSPQFYVSSEYENVAQILDNVTKVIGNHTVKAGVNFQRIRVQTEQPTQSRGTFNFTGKFTQDPQSTGTSGFGLADMLQNQIASTALSNLFTVRNQRWYRTAYAEDSWQVTPRLTLNYGIRYEYAQPLEELEGHQANFVPNYANNTGLYLIPSKSRNVPLPAGLTSALAANNIAISYTNNNFLVNPDQTNFAPRIGVAYKVTDNMVVRAGYGIFYGGLESVGFFPNLGENAPFEFDSNFPSAGCAPGACPTNGQTLETGFSAALAAGLSNFASTPALRAYQPNVQTPYSEQWNLTVERSFGEQTTATVAYVGAVDHHLQSNPDPNQAVNLIAPGGNAQAARPFNQFGGSSLISYGGFSSYNSGQATLERRYRNGLSFLGAYTFSHSLDDAFLPLGGAGQTASGYRNWRQFGFGFDYGDSFQDIRHRFTLNGQYALPVGQGKRFLDRGGLIDEVVGGWSTSLVFRVQTGQPVIAYANNNSTNGIGNGGNNTNAETFKVADVYSTGGTPQAGAGVKCATKTRTVATWVNPCAFNNPPVATGSGDLASYGPPGRTVFFGPGYNRVDMSLFKNFKLIHETNLLFRADGFNMFNTPAYGQPSNTLGSSFGQITNERFTGEQPDARVFQFSADFSF